MAMSSYRSLSAHGEILTSVERHHHRTTAEKIRLVEESQQAGSSVSFVAHRYGHSPNLLFTLVRSPQSNGIAEASVKTPKRNRRLIPTCAEGGLTGLVRVALSDLFVQVLRLCRAAGLVEFAHVAVDGNKLKANASRHKAMSYGRKRTAEPALAAEVQAWLERAREADAAEDQAHGAGCRGDATPDWMADKATAGSNPRRQGRLGSGGDRFARSGGRERAGGLLGHTLAGPATAR
jgi:hypothetical protein